MPPLLVEHAVQIMSAFVRFTPAKRPVGYRLFYLNGLPHPEVARSTSAIKPLASPRQGHDTLREEQPRPI